MSRIKLPKLKNSVVLSVRDMPITATPQAPIIKLMEIIKLLVTTGGGPDFSYRSGKATEECFMDDIL